MAVRFQLKTGEGIPSSLKVGEPAFDIINNKLYIGDNNGKSVEIGNSNENNYLEIYESDIDNCIGKYDSEKEIYIPQLYKVIGKKNEQNDLNIDTDGEIIIDPSLPDNNKFNEYYIYAMTINEPDMVMTGVLSHLQYKINETGIYERKGFFATGVRIWNNWYKYITNKTTDLIVVLLERLQYYGDANIIPTDDSYFDITENGEISLKEDFKSDTTLTEIVVPYKINDIIVSKIDSVAFIDCSQITNIIMPNTIINIGESAFQNCSQITNIIIPKNVATIENGLFAGCANLTNIIIPDNVKSIGGFAFSGCDNLKTIEIPNTVTSIDDSAFLYCLSDLTITCSQGSTADTYAKENGIKVRYNNIDISSILRFDEDGYLVVSIDGVEKRFIPETI